MVPISVVIIAFNEEKNIGRCLDSVKDIADDVVVVDSFSSDRTEAICKAKGARFIQHRFDGYIEQKNFAITQAQFSHILSLDADEMLSEELKKSILQIKHNWIKDGYYMNRLTNYCGRWIYHCGWYPDRKLRLWDSTKGAWAGTNPHDKYQIFEGDKATGFLKGDILHYSYSSVSEHYQQADKFSTIAAKEMHHKGKTISKLIIYIKAAFKFLRNYFIKLGFLDGTYGFIICKITAWETYLKYLKLHQLNNKNDAR